MLRLKTQATLNTSSHAPPHEMAGSRMDEEHKAVHPTARYFREQQDIRLDFPEVESHAPPHEMTGSRMDEEHKAVHPTARYFREQQNIRLDFPEVECHAPPHEMAGSRMDEEHKAVHPTARYFREQQDIRLDFPEVECHAPPHEMAGSRMDEEHKAVHPTARYFREQQDIRLDFPEVECHPRGGNIMEKPMNISFASMGNPPSLPRQFELQRPRIQAAVTQAAQAAPRAIEVDHPRREPMERFEILEEESPVVQNAVTGIRMPQPTPGFRRTCTPRRRYQICVGLFFAVVASTAVLMLITVKLEKENNMNEQLGGMMSKIEFLEAEYFGRQDEKLIMKEDGQQVVNPTSKNVASLDQPIISPVMEALLKNITGSKTAAGLKTQFIPNLQTMYVNLLLPHLMQDSNSLKPAFLMSGGRLHVDIVIGIPHVKRDKESYLMVTLTHLINVMSDQDINTTLIIVMVGETDLEYVIKTARQIEIGFPKYVERGFIEVISPSPAYYPDFDKLPATLGDSKKRVKWRTKQNLDTIFLMAYGRSKGTFYLMLEDDIIAKNNFIQDIKHFIEAVSNRPRKWAFIEFCHVGGIGKLFRSADLPQFITYVQMFYNNMPIDWLLESYLADRVCKIDKSAVACVEAKKVIRPKYKSSLFQHIGIYSSLKGKIQKVKATQFGTVPTFHPHKNNPPLKEIKSTIMEHTDHSLKKAYEGEDFFWGMKPKKGDTVEFWFLKPVVVTHYLFRSANIEHISDKFYGTSVEVKARDAENFTTVGHFDEFGLAEADLNVGFINAIRLKVNQDSKFWVILSEIELKSRAESR